MIQRNQKSCRRTKISLRYILVQKACRRAEISSRYILFQKSRRRANISSRYILIGSKNRLERYDSSCMYVFNQTGNIWVRMKTNFAIGIVCICRKSNNPKINADRHRDRQKLWTIHPFTLLLDCVYFTKKEVSYWLARVSVKIVSFSVGRWYIPLFSFVLLEIGRRITVGFSDFYVRKSTVRNS